MEYETAFSSPHQAFFTKDKRNELGIEKGDPVEIKFEELDEPVVVKASDLSGLEKKQELHAMFFSVHYCLTEISTVHNGLFKRLSPTDTELSSEVSKKLQDGNGIESYIWSISHLNEFRFSKADIALGCGIIDYLVGATEETELELINSPFAQHAKSTVSRSLNEDLPEIQEVKKYEGDLIRPSSIYVCTYHANITDQQKDELRAHITNDRYIMPTINYEYHIKNIPAHSLITDTETEGILIATEDNVKFTRKRQTSVKLLTDENINLDQLSEYLSNDSPIDDKYEFDIIRPRNELLMLDFETDTYVEISESDQGFEFGVAHATEDDPTEVESVIADTMFGLQDEFDLEVEMNAKANTPREALLTDKWVLDTNSIYRQRPGEDYNSISEFLLKTSQIYNKEFKVPWNVLCEINKHKDVGKSRTRNASKQGIENLKILDCLDKSDLIDLKIEEIPDSIDNSIQENSGVTDLAILNAVPDDGILVTSDKHLSDLANIIDIYTESIENISRLSESDHGEPYWDLLEVQLSQKGPLKYQTVIQMLQSEEVDETEEMVNKDPEQVIQDKIRDGKIIEVVEDEEISLALSSSRRIIPTVSLINDLIRNREEVNGDTYLTESTLESIRSAIGGMPTTHRPKLTFLIPSEYVFRSSEVSQIDSLETLRNLKNSQFSTINRNIEEDMDTNVENAMIKSSLEENAIILCSFNEDVRMHNLLGLDFKKVRLD